MKNKIEITAREREILSIINNRLNFGLSAQNQETDDGIYEILAIAWDTPKETLHDMGIGKFKIALMYSRLLGVRGFLSQCRPSMERGLDFSYMF